MEFQRLFDWFIGAENPYPFLALGGIPYGHFDQPLTVLAHTKMVLENCLCICDELRLTEEEREILCGSGIAHDLGKLWLTRRGPTGWCSHGYEGASAKWVRENFNGDWGNKVSILCKYHSIPKNIDERGLERLKKKLEGLDLLLKLLFKADKMSNINNTWREPWWWKNFEKSG